MIQVETLFDNPAPDECPTTFQETVDALNELVHSEIQSEVVPYITGAATPAVEDQDKVWHRVDANGRPIGTYVFYSGSWRREYTVPIGTVTMYGGNPGTDFTGAGHKGKIGGEWDGWQLCTGENGSPNLSNKFVVGAKMDDLAVGYPEGSGPWTTSVSGESSQEGGDKEITLDDTNTYQRPVPEIKLGQYTADGNTAGTTLFGLRHNNPTDVVFQASDDGNLEPPAISTLPPYYALAFAIFVGYE